MLRVAGTHRLDAAADPPPGLHDGDTLRVARIERPKPLVLTVGNDGAVRVWDERDQRSTTLAIPTGGVNDLVCWTEGNTALVAVTSVNLMQVFDVGTAAVRGEFEFPGGPNRMAHLTMTEGWAVAAAAGSRVYVLDQTGPEPWWDDPPTEAPDVKHVLPTTAPSITALAWVDRPERPELVIATGGGRTLALRIGHRAVEEVRDLADGMGVILTVCVVAIPNGPPRVALGSLDGQLRLVDVDSGRLVRNLTKDSARICGATVTRASDGRQVLVTTHRDRDARRVTGLRVWDPGTGDQLHGIVRPSLAGDPSIGAPHSGCTAAGLGFVGQLVEDGVEVLLLSATPQRIHLPLPVAANDLCVSGDVLYVAGGGGHLAIKIGHP